MSNADAGRIGAVVAGTIALILVALAVVLGWLAYVYSSIWLAVAATVAGVPALVLLLLVWTLVSS
jgi:hypothetical protein